MSFPNKNANASILAGSDSRLRNLAACLKSSGDPLGPLGDIAITHALHGITALTALATIVILGVILGGCTPMAGATYRLYRSSGDSAPRVHFASFNSIRSGDFNRQNCDMTLGLLTTNLQRADPSSTVRFWCAVE